MEVTVSGHQMDVGDALRSRITDELSDGVGKYFERGGVAEVRITPDGHAFRVDCQVNLASGQLLVSHGMGGDAHAAFDDALTKIEKRVRRYKRKLKNHHNPAGKALNGDSGETAPYIVLQAPADDEPEDELIDGAEGGDEPLVVAESEAVLRSMTVAMAVLELDLSGRPVLLFRNAAHGGLAVVYKRSDGNIGWIDPERIRSSAQA